MELEQAIGVIDIGSNSFHLVVGGYHNRDYFKILDDYKVNVRLCEGVAETGYMKEDRMKYGEETLIMFKNLCESYHLENIVTIATAAVRKALNGPDFVKRIKENVGIDITVIPGKKEAEFDYLGSVNTIDFKDAITMDIGGGSCQFCLVHDRQIVDSISLQFGSIDLMEMFDLGDKIKSRSIKDLKNFLKENFDSVKFLKNGKHLPVVGIGGTIRNIGRVHRNLDNYPLEIAHNYTMSKEEVEYVVDTTVDMDYEERRNLAGLAKGRADIFPGAAYAVKYLMEYIDSDKLIISNSGIRDGVIFDYFGYGPDNLVHNIFDNSLINTMLLYDCNIEHSYYILGLASKIARELHGISKIDQDFGRVLKASAMLHDMGIYINFMNHQEHSFYLILNAGLEGLSQKEILTSAFITLHHRSSKKVRISDIYQKLLTDKDRELIDEVSLYLQLSEILDRTLDNVVKDLSFELTDKKAIMHVTAVGHSIMPDMVEDECRKKFRRVFGLELEVKEKVVKDKNKVVDKIRKENKF